MSYVDTVIIARDELLGIFAKAWPEGPADLVSFAQIHYQT